MTPRIALLSRWLGLRRRGLHYPLLQEGDRIYSFESGDPWGTKSLVSWERLEREVVELEAGQVKRKEMAREYDATHRQHVVRHS